MRSFLLLAGAVASLSASTPQDSTCGASSGASSGVVLLQRPSTFISNVDLDDHGQHLPFLRQTFPEHSAPHLGGPLVGLTELQPVLEEQQTFSVLVSGEWSRWTPHHKAHKHTGMRVFLSSVVFFDWCLFGSACMTFFILHMLVLGRMGENGHHLAVLMIWLAVGLVYNAVIWGRFGSNAGMSWFAGYVLEFIFLVENIFIFHIVVQAFKTPVKLTTKALHIVVWGQILFEMIFFMGLAHWLRSFQVLPYLLGVWLICCGLLAARGDHSLEVDIMETRACRAFTGCLGDRLSKSYEKEGQCMLRDSTGKMRVSLLGLVVFVLLIVDFLLEIDVVLTKIEEFPNHYIAFTSSAVAAFSMPELFFVSKGLLHRFCMLKYGIAFVLVLFGTQMLFASFYILKPLVACSIIVGVLAVSVVLSCIISFCDEKDGHAGQALSEVGEGNPQAADDATDEDVTEDAKADDANEQAEDPTEKEAGKGGVGE